MLVTSVVSMTTVLDVLMSDPVPVTIGVLVLNTLFVKGPVEEILPVTHWQ
jgi:hypothetical protein